MAEQHQFNVLIEDIGNPKIQADVPKTQVIRNGQEKCDDIYTSVLKVTKNEATFTKGDKRLQKVTVTEENPTTCVNPVYSEIQSEIIPTQLVRKPNEETKKELESKNPKSKTRIPIKKFKETVNKVSQRRSSVEGKDVGDQVPKTQTSRDQRKSSLPKLIIPPNGNNHKTEPHTLLADEEFDKIFDEIVDSDKVIDDTLLKNTKINDPVSLEHNFDEIAEAYDKNLLRPIDVTNVKETKDTALDINKHEGVESFQNSRIPLGRFKSVQEVKLPKNSVRRRSLKSGGNDDFNKVKDVELSNEKYRNDKQINNNNDKVKVKQIIIDNKKLGDDKKTKDKEVKALHKELVSILNTDDDKNKVVVSSIPKLVKEIRTKQESDIAENKVIAGPTIDVNKDLTENNVIDEIKEKVTKDGELVKYNATKIANNDLPKTVDVKEQATGNQKKQGKKHDYQTDRDFVKDVLKNIDAEHKMVTEENQKGDINQDKTKTYVKAKEHSIKAVESDVDDRKRKMVSSEGQLRLQKLGNQFDDVSYKDSRQKQAEMDPMNTPVDYKIPFDGNVQSSYALVKQAVGKLKDADNVKNFRMSDGDSEEIMKDGNAKQKVKEDFNLQNNTYSNFENDSANGKISPIVENKINKLPHENNMNEKVTPKDLLLKEDIQNNQKNNETALPDNLPKETNDIDNETTFQKDVEIYEGGVNFKVNKKSSVLSKIAMFEKKAPVNNQLTKPKHLTAVPKDETLKKPRIVEEVLKTRIIRQKSVKGDDIFIEQDIADDRHSTKEHIIMPEIISVDNVHETNTKNYTKDGEIKIKNSEFKDIIPNHTKEPIVQINSNPNEDKNNNNLKVKPVNEDFSEAKPILSEFKRFDKKPIYNSVENLFKGIENKIETTNNNNTESKLSENNDNKERPKLTRAKSLADIELGDAIKGKVEFVIKNINIKNNNETELTKEVINIRERPRKRSVADKIAIFEKKLVAIEIEDEKSQTQNTLPDSEKQNGGNEKPRELDEEVKKKIDDLLTAKLRYRSVESMPYVKLSDGRKMPVLALGTALLEPNIAKYVVGAAIDLGYRAIDTAYIYGNEKHVGEGIQAKISDGTVKREDLFIMSKLWSTFHRPDLAEKACNDTLTALGLNYLDLLMIHNPMSFKEGADPIPKIANVLQYSDYDYLDAWRAMEELQQRGLVRSIGVSNFNSEQIDRIVEKGRVKPVVNQVECQPYLSQRRLSDHCRSRAIVISCYGALGSKGTPAEYKSPGSTPVIDDAVVKVVASDLGATPAKVLIRYQLQKGHAVVTKSSTSAHIKDNLEALDMKLSDRHMDMLDGLNRNQRNFNFKGMGDTHRNYPFKKSF